MRDGTWDAVDVNHLTGHTRILWTGEEARGERDLAGERLDERHQPPFATAQSDCPKLPTWAAIEMMLMTRPRPRFASTMASTRSGVVRLRSVP